MSAKPNAYVAIRDHGVRTYGDLIRVAARSSYNGTCCACHKWGLETWQISTRANICRECCERKATEVLGSIVRVERRARSWIKRHPNVRSDPAFIARVSGASLKFVTAEIARVQGRS